MKHTIRGLRPILLSAAVIGLMAAATQIVSAGLVAHYRFNDSLNDETGKYNARLRDSLEVPLYEAGKADNAILIDSEGSSLEVDPTMFVMNQDFTIAAWVLTQKGGEVCVVYKGPKAAFGGKSRQFNLYGGDGLGGNGIFFFTGDSGAYGTSWQASHGITVNDGTWHHVAVSYSVTNTPHFILFVDGIGKIGTDPGSYFSGDFVMQPDGPDNVLRIGGRDDAGGYTTFSGLMDEVQIYNQALTRDEVKFLFDNPTEVILPPDVPTIRRQPQSQTVLAGGSVTFTVEAEARSPLNYQWQFKGTNLPGATSAALTLSPVTTNHAGPYTVVVSNAAGTVTSAPATLTVNVDTTPPTISNVFGVVIGPLQYKQVVIVFSEPVTAATAGQMANYSLNRGVTISSVNVDNSTTVRLTTSELTPATLVYAVTVSNVRDTAFGEGNLIAPGTQVSFVVNVFLPLDVGQTVNGFQDEFDAAARDPNWIATGADAYEQTGGVLKVTTMAGDPNHLLYQAPGYSNATQEVLARIKINLYTAGGSSRAGVTAACDPEAIHTGGNPGEGINLLFIDNDFGDGAGPKQFRLLNDYIAWGPVGPPEWRSWQTNTWYWLRLRQTASTGANNISGKVWLADGTMPEPSNWQLTWTQAGRTGFAGIQGPSGGATDVDVDYVLIKAAGLPSVKVAAPRDIPVIPPGTVSITVTQQPRSVISEVNSTATFTVGATSTGPDALSYQWQRNNIDIPGATGAAYTTPPLNVAHQGAQYRVMVSAPGANAFSAPATVGVFSLNRYGGITLYGIPGRRHEIQYTDAVGPTTNWVTLTTVTLPTSPYIYYDLQSPNAAKRFYRAVVVP